MVQFNTKIVAAAATAIAALLGFQSTFAQTAMPPQPLSPITLAGDATRGAQLAETCFGCHGVPGYHNAYPTYMVPKLGGQNADYLEIALQGYRRGTRSHPTMQVQAASLSDQDIADIAQYLSTLPGEAEAGRGKQTTAQLEEGRRKATACVQCHGQEGVAAAPQWPNLAGQHESYLLEALSQYKSGKRVDLLMNPLIGPLDQQTIEELAAFFSSQEHLYTTARE